MMWLLLSAILALTLLLLATLRETKARRTALESELSALQERVSALIKGVAGQSKKLEGHPGTTNGDPAKNGQTGPPNGHATRLPLGHQKRRFGQISGRADR